MTNLEKTSLIVAYALCLVGVARAQTAVPYTWTAPSQWDNGTALTSAQIAAYDIACRFVPAGGGTPTTCTLSKSSFAGGAAVSDTVNATIPTAGGDLCITLTTRTTAAAGSATSIPSNEACKNFTAAKPNPPTNLRSVSVGISINLNSGDGFNRTVAFRLDSLGRRSGTVCGFVKIETPCTGEKLFTYLGQDYYHFLEKHPRTGSPNMAGWTTTDAGVCAVPCA